MSFIFKYVLLDWSKYWAKHHTCTLIVSPSPIWSTLRMAKVQRFASCEPLSVAQEAPSVPANRDGMGGNVVLNQGAGILGTTLTPVLPAHQTAITSTESVMMGPHCFTGDSVFHAVTTTGQVKLTNNSALM